MTPVMRTSIFMICCILSFLSAVLEYKANGKGSIIFMNVLCSILYAICAVLNMR